MTDPADPRSRRSHRLVAEHGTRFLKFGAVGVLGIGVNLAAYALFYDVAEIPDFVARALAIEVAVLHNFAWNYRWTWSDRGRSRSHLHGRLLRYHGSTFVASFLIPLGVGALLDWLLAGLPYSNYISHLAGIGCGMLVNYLLSDRWVFKRDP